MIVASGLEVASLVTNIFIAVGTIGATSVALFLGVGAQRNERLRSHEQRLAAARQVLAVYHQERGKSGGSLSHVDAANGHHEAIHDIQLSVLCRNSDAVWRFHEPPTSALRLEYLLPNQSRVLEGHFYAISPGVPEGQLSITNVRINDVEVHLSWTDAHGLRWSRINAREPQAT